jgi:hypothetical protein
VTTVEAQINSLAPRPSAGERHPDSPQRRAIVLDVLVHPARPLDLAIGLHHAAVTFAFTSMATD